MKEVLFFILFIIVLFLGMGLMGAFDNDEDNPFKNNKNQLQIKK